MLNQTFIVAPTCAYQFPYVEWAKASMSNITGRAIQLSRAYLKILSRIERGGLDSFVLADIDAQRTDAHDALITELRACGIEGIGFGFDERAHARELALKIDKWLRED